MKLKISIHAPHTGRDPPQSTTRKRSVHFNPRAPYGARQSFGLGKTVQEIEFQSTRPIRGATNTKRLLTSSSPNFNPRAPYGARPWPALRGSALTNFNPRAPYGARHGNTFYFAYIDRFQSTRPIRGATRRDRRRHHQAGDFNPRAPYGARLKLAPGVKLNLGFQSTRPIRGATVRRISCGSLRRHFNPRAPYGARLTPPYRNLSNRRISIHAPHTGRDGVWVGLVSRVISFQSTRPIRGATICGKSRKKNLVNFNPRAPYGARPSRPRHAPHDNKDFNPRAPYGARPQ